MFIRVSFDLRISNVVAKLKVKGHVYKCMRVEEGEPGYETRQSVGFNLRNSLSTHFLTVIIQLPVDLQLNPADCHVVSTTLTYSVTTTCTSTSE